MKATIIAAQKAQSKNERLFFHYIAWRNPVSGVTHNGLLEDIEAIKMGVKEKLENIDHDKLSPKTIEPIKGDYLLNRN